MSFYVFFSTVFFFCFMLSSVRLSHSIKEPAAAAAVFGSLGFWDRGLMTRPVWDRPRSCRFGFGLGLIYFGLASNTVVPDKALCDMISPVLFRAISAETVPNVTGHHTTIPLFNVFLHKVSCFLITNMHAATEEFFFCYLVLLLLNWSWSWS